MELRQRRCGASRTESQAEAYLSTAYSPCLNHGIKGGLGNSQMQAGSVLWKPATQSLLYPL